MTDPTAEAVIAQAFREIGAPYVLGAEGPTRFDCSGLVYYCFKNTGHEALIGFTRKLAAGYAHYFAGIGKFSRNFADAERGDLIVYVEHAGDSHVSHIGIYLGNDEVISALIPPYGVKVTKFDHINVAFYGVCLVDYPSDPGRTGGDTPGGTTTDPETRVVFSGSPTLVTPQVLYDGVDITAYVEFRSARFMTQAGGLAGDCQLRVKDAGHVFASDYFHTGGTLELFIDGLREWDGWVITVGREWAFPVDITTDPAVTPRYWILEGYDRNWLFQKRYCYDLLNPTNVDIGTYPALTDDSAVLRDMLDHYVDIQDDGLDTVSGITTVGPLDPYEPVHIFSLGMLWADTLHLIGGMNGAIIYIGPDRVIYYVDDTTDTAPFALSDEPAEGEVGYREMVIQIEATNLYNDVYIWGVGVGNANPVFAHTIDDASAADHGLFQFGETYNGMYKQQSVQQRADSMVYGSKQHYRGHKDDVVRITCTIYQPGLRVGQGISFHAGIWDFGAQVSYDPTDLVYDPSALDKNTEFQRMLDRIAHIESNGNYVDQNKRTGAYGKYQIMPANWRVWGPLALGHALSTGYAARYVDPSLWQPPVTPANQETVARWRIGQLYNNKGQDPRRVAASWRSGPSVGSREPSTWSRGTLLYVNHVAMPLGYPETTVDTVLGAITEPTQDTTDSYQASQGVDDVYPIRKIEISFPTPNGVRYDLMLSHEYDAVWSYQDPIPTPTIPPGGTPGVPGPLTETEVINLYGPPGSTTSQPGSDETLLGETFTIFCRGWAARGVYGHNHFDGVHEVWVQDGAGSASDQILTSENAPGIYSAVGRGHGQQALLTTVITNPCGDDAFTNWEDSEQWYGPVSAGLALANAQWPVELRVANSPQLIKGYVPGVFIGLSATGPEDGKGSGGSSSYGTSSKIAALGNLTPGDISYDPNWATIWGEPFMEAEFATVVLPIGTLTEGQWLTVSPGWECQRLDYPGLFCDTSAVAFWGTDAVGAACANRGPECSGMGRSGSFAGTGPFQSIALTVVGMQGGYTTPANDPSPNTQTSPVMQPDATYQTKYPYVENTLEMTWQGTKLARGIDYFETDPTTGKFTLKGLDGGESWITVTYVVVDGTLPTTTPDPGIPATITPTGSVYRPHPQSQFGWGTAWDGQNCNMAAAAMALDRQTLGAFSDTQGSPRSTAPNMRTYSGVTGPNSFVRVGTSIADAVHAWTNGWNEALLNPGPVSFAYLVAQLQDGRGAIVQGIETAIPEPYRRTNWPDGHAIYVNEIFQDGSFWVVDPLGHYPTIFPYSVLETYARALHGGNDVVTCAFTRRTPQV